MRALRRAGVGRPPRYDRDWDLPRLLAVWPQEIADLSIEGRALILGRLEQALRAERQRGVAGHWSYDVARHAQLIVARRAEAGALAAARRVARRAGMRRP